ncbi:hypothetical protein FACS189479_07780 [Spirochaetia bacterium]|nr:hypothetical protein FACS189479_07780 [Spirochaetia bacterium]
MKKSFVLIAAALTAAALVFTACPPADGSNQDTTAPAEVTGLNAVPANRQVTLTWTAPVDSDFNKVEITFTPAADGVTQPISVPKGTNTKVITGLANGTAYTFRVKTVDDSGNKSAGETKTETPGDAFVPVTNITNVPLTGAAGTAVDLSTAVVNPDNATNKTIVWSVKTPSAGITTITGNGFTPTGSGTVTVTATIVDGTAVGTNYTQDFEITVTSSFVPVANITGVPTTGAAGAKVNLGTAVVNPSDATNQTIVWSVKTPGAGINTITGDSFIPTEAGTITMTAAITNGLAVGTPYTQDFVVTVTSSFVPVANITNVPLTGTAGTAVNLGTAVVNPSDATNQTIVWSVTTPGAGITTITGNSFTPTGSGTVTVTATIANGTAVGTNYTQDFDINVFKAVTSITNVPTYGNVGAAVNLGTVVVNPSDATNQNIVWSVTTVGTTGAVISGTSLSAASRGTVTVTATITNGLAVGTPYTQNFVITMITVGVWQQWVDTGASVTLDYSVAADGIVEVIVGGTAEVDIWRADVKYKYTAVANKKYKYTFEAWTASGTRTVRLGYYNNQPAFFALPDQTLTTTHKTFTLVGKEIPVGGERELQFLCADATGTFYVKMISITETTDEPTAWDKWVDTGASVTLDYSIAADGTIEVIVGGTAEVDPWRADVRYKYTAVTNKKYKYTFEAWAASGTRTVRLGYYNNQSAFFTLPDQTLTTTHKTFTLVGKEIPVGGDWNLQFFCADATGIFYVKVISITETNDEPTVAWSSGWAADTSTVTLDYSVDGNQVKVTVGGTPDDGRWKAGIGFYYTHEVGKKYKYTFEAWTESGTRILRFGYLAQDVDLSLTTTPQTFAIVGKEIPADDNGYVRFQCADATGTFYLKLISVVETNEATSPPVTL